MLNQVAQIGYCHPWKYSTLTLSNLTCSGHFEQELNQMNSRGPIQPKLPHDSAICILNASFWMY